MAKWFGGYSRLRYFDLQSGKIESIADPITATLGEMLLGKMSDCRLASIPIYFRFAFVFTVETSLAMIASGSYKTCRLGDVRVTLWIKQAHNTSCIKET